MGTRTPDLPDANRMLYQLSYRPVNIFLTGLHACSALPLSYGPLTQEAYIKLFLIRFFNWVYACANLLRLSSLNFASDFDLYAS